MNSVWTPLHVALGLSGPSPLAIDLIQQAVSSQVSETGTLEWKSALPGTDQQAREEAVKDLAAMANSGGGLIVYGLAEDQGRAASLTPVDISESTQRRLLQIAGSAQPPVLGIVPVPLPLPEGSEQGVLVLIVPGSAHAPHLVLRGEKFRVPYRDGARVAYMSESQLERAYQERRQRREGSERQLVEQEEDFLARVDREKAPWLIAVAIPEVPLTQPTRLGKQDVTAILNAALKSTQAWVDQSSVVIRSLADPSLRVMPGLQRWIVPTFISGNWTDMSRHAHAEIHQNGSVSLGACTDEFIVAPRTWDDRHPVEAELVEQFVLEFVTLLAVMAEYRGVPGTYDLRIRFGRQDDLPLVLLDSSPSGSRTDHVRGIAVRRFTPVMSSVTPLPGSVESVAASLSLDVLHQFGVDSLGRLPKPE